jgi:carboxyl-terminal processing protease
MNGLTRNLVQEIPTVQAILEPDSKRVSTLEDFGIETSKRSRFTSANRQTVIKRTVCNQHPSYPASKSPSWIRTTGGFMKKSILAIIIAASSFSPAMASPAQDLFDQATFYMGFYYAGYGKVANFRDLRKQYQPELDKRCGTDKACGYDKGLEVIDVIIKAIGDPFMKVFTETEFFDQQLRGGGEGRALPRVGVLTRASKDGLIVARTYDGEAAWEAGIERGDVIKSVNGKPATLEALAGAELEKKPVVLSVSRAGGAAKDYSLKAVQPDEGVKPYTTPSPKNVMVIHIPDFYWSGEVSKKINQLVRKADGDGVKGIILDVRDSESGYDSEALLATAPFISKGGFVYDRRFVDQDQTITLDGNKLFIQNEKGQPRPLAQLDKLSLTKLPVAVLVNKFTENSAEMFAHFLQNAKRAKVYGEPSMGVLNISGGAEGELISGHVLNLSTLRMLELDRKPFPNLITPDVSVADDLAALVSGKDLVLEKAIADLN